MKKLQVGTDRFKGKPPLKCFSCGRVGHYIAKCSYKEIMRKIRMFRRVMLKETLIVRKNFYTHEDSECSSSNEGDESD